MKARAGFTHTNDASAHSYDSFGREFVKKKHTLTPLPGANLSLQAFSVFSLT
jgi:hypothetical protein